MTLYPKDMGLHIYTDGSAKDDGPVAADFYCQNLFEGSLAADSQSAILTVCSLCSSNLIEVEEVMKRRTLAKPDCNLPQPSGSLSCKQPFSNIFRSVGKYIFRIQEKEARGKIWETLLHSPVPMGLPRQVFSAVFRTLTGRLFLQATLSANWCERHSRAPSVSLRRGYEFYSPDGLCFPGQHRF
ncbi:hypothetical protein TNCV_1953181 [Trichonephila clavipes]|nr:hypothetical protein TNCV_1953181 [Trichonephila clavipes]